jgi:hypothetical protein
MVVENGGTALQSVTKEDEEQKWSEETRKRMNMLVLGLNNVESSGSAEVMWSDVKWHFSWQEKKTLEHRRTAQNAPFE